MCVPSYLLSVVMALGFTAVCVCVCFMDFTSTPELMDTGMDRSLPVEGEGDKGEEGRGKEGRERKGGGEGGRERREKTDSGVWVFC